MAKTSHPAPGPPPSRTGGHAIPGEANGVGAGTMGSAGISARGDARIQTISGAAGVTTEHAPAGRPVRCAAQWNFPRRVSAVRCRIGVIKRKHTALRTFAGAAFIAPALRFKAFRRLCSSAHSTRLGRSGDIVPVDYSRPAASIPLACGSAAPTVSVDRSHDFVDCSNRLRKDWNDHAASALAWANWRRHRVVLGTSVAALRHIPAVSPQALARLQERLAHRVPIGATLPSTSSAARGASRTFILPLSLRPPTPILA